MSQPTRRFRHGLVLGKFYPPHAGHHLLISTAAAACDQVSVLVLAASVESIPLDLRVAWVREAHPEPHVRVLGGYDDVPVDYDDPEIWEAHMAVFRSVLASGGEHAARTPVDAVFTSEPYGDELARRFGAVHVPVDPCRSKVPCSSTLVRRDPVACWEYLSPAVRAWLARRVVVVGAESTGTTTMARALAAAYRARGGVWAETRWVPEYGRTFTYEKLALAQAEALATGRPPATMDDLFWTTSDFVVIAERQLTEENRLARLGSPVLFCDTDPLATTIWHERYLGFRSPEVEAVAARARHDLWLLTSHEGVPFEQDGYRDGEHIRPWMTERFREELDKRGMPYVELTGSHEERLRTAIAAVDELLARGWEFADPLG
ncbi:transcriptional regulator [Carbonactinospora thermoautotrophica]|uniref:AAA family ATPase n=1 Tax=Carbonactinospora thermoautotrophica TaxID=1469144 RepID=UPI00226DA35B|nr:AAA family ATPase [Carbonactinospora thermoautotrophica]MCX9191436.1 transcriptional regulator [Carbonactinospora thermoautotrophica]